MTLDAVSIMNKLLMKNPKERLGADGSVDTIRQHPFFRGIDWMALKQKRVEPPERPANIEEEAANRNRQFKKLLRSYKESDTTKQEKFSWFSFVNSRKK
jgi:hypothetical protein